MCRQKYEENWQVKNKEKYLAIQRSNQQRYNKRYPDKIIAHSLATKNELKGNYCELCSSADNLETHHPDYTKPLEVITLCRECHRRQHDQN